MFLFECVLMYVSVKDFKRFEFRWKQQRA